MYKIVANWKMYLTIQESRELAANVAKWWLSEDCKNVELVVCPSFLALFDVARHLPDSVSLGAQNVAISADLGAYTGQVAAQHLEEAGCEQVIIGHSETRQFLGETDEGVRKKLKVLLNNGLKAIVCIGEDLEQRESGSAEQTVVDQLHTIFDGIEITADNVSIAYEPRWAISAVSGGKAVPPAEAGRMHQLISHSMKEYTDADVKILYGGSVDSENILDFLHQEGVSGALVGSASADSERLKKIVQTLQASVC